MGEWGIGNGFGAIGDAIVGGIGILSQFVS